KPQDALVPDNVFVLYRGLSTRPLLASRHEPVLQAVDDWQCLHGYWSPDAKSCLVEFKLDESSSVAISLPVHPCFRTEMYISGTVAKTVSPAISVRMAPKQLPL